MPVLIKRYRNRKLYNTASKQYITLEQIEELIKAEQEVKVVDNTTGADITASTLSQIIFEEEKNRSGYLPLSLLFSLVQSSGERIEDIRRNIFSALHLTHHYDVEIERRVNQLVDNGELSQEAGAQLLGKLIHAGMSEDETGANIEGRIVNFLRQRQIPTRNDLHDLMQKIDDLSKRVEELKSNSVE